MYSNAPYNPYGYAQQQPAQGLTIKEKLAFGLAGVIVIGGAVILLRSMVRSRQADSEQKLTYIDGNAATFAKQIKMAFANDGWWGTNTQALRETITHIPSKQVLRQVIAAYQKMYNRSLLRDMESELKSSEYNEMLAIISAKPEQYNGIAQAQLNAGQFQSWAARLKAAFDMTYGPIPGTDEPAIKTVFAEMPTQAAFTQTALTYKAMYGRDLVTDLKGELEFWEYPSYMQIITNKPK